MMDYKANLESLMLSYYVKYDRLLPMVNVSFDKYTPQKVDIYVDLYDMLKPVYTREVFANKKFVVVSSIINLVAHYRRYFATRHSAPTRIYLIYGAGTSLSHKTFINDFGDDSFKDSLGFAASHKFLMDQLKLVKILAGYIQDVYFIEKNAIFSVVAQDMIASNPGVPSIVLTKTSYALQIPAFNKNAIMVRPKKLADGDQSYFVSYNTVVANYYNKIGRDSTIKKILELQPELISLLMTISGLQSYEVKAITNSTQAVSMVHDAITNSRIINGYNNDIDFVYDNLNGVSRFIDKTTFKFRFNAIDIITQQRIYQNTPESKDTTWLVNFYDPEAVKDINDKYFVDCPLDLESL